MALLEKSSLALFIATDEGVVVACNQAAGELLLRHQDAIVGHGIWTFDEGHARTRVESMHRTLRDDPAVLTNSVYRRSDDTLVLVEAQIVPCIWRGEVQFLGMVVPIAELTSPAGDRLLSVDAFATKGGVIVKCAWCDLVYQHPDEWVAKPVANVSLPVSHGLCPACFAALCPADTPDAP